MFEKRKAYTVWWGDLSINYIYLFFLSISKVLVSVSKKPPSSTLIACLYYLQMLKKTQKQNIKLMLAKLSLLKRVTFWEERKPKKRLKENSVIFWLKSGG